MRFGKDEVDCEEEDPSSKIQREIAGKEEESSSRSSCRTAGKKMPEYGRAETGSVRFGFLHFLYPNPNIRFLKIRSNIRSSLV